MSIHVLELTGNVRLSQEESMISSSSLGYGCGWLQLISKVVLVWETLSKINNNYYYERVRAHACVCVLFVIHKLLQQSNSHNHCNCRLWDDHRVA